MTAADTQAALREHFASQIVESYSFRDEVTTIVVPEAAVEILRFLRDEQSFNHLSDITAVDWPDRDPRFDVVYHMYSFNTYVWYRIKTRVAEHQPVPTAVGLFPGANWAEREVYDLFGITFSGHPQLNRILMPEGWVGHPLRKDYPMSQITLPRSGATKIPE